MSRVGISTRLRAAIALFVGITLGPAAAAPMNDALVEYSSCVWAHFDKLEEQQNVKLDAGENSYFITRDEFERAIFAPCDGMYRRIYRMSEDRRYADERGKRLAKEMVENFRDKTIEFWLRYNEALSRERGWAPNEARSTF